MSGYLYRGMPASFKVNFYDASGNFIDPTNGANLTLAYPDGSGGVTTTTVSLVQTIGTHDWTYLWDTRHKAPGRVDWHAESLDTPSAAVDGYFNLLANLANLAVP